MVVFLSFCLFLFLSIVCCLYIIYGVLYARVVRDLVTFKLTRNTSLTLDPELVMASLQDRFYPIRTSLLSCIKLPEANRNNFDLKPQFINTLPKFHGLESDDAYFFVREFEEVYLMMCILQVGDDAVRQFIPFSLKDLTKKWLYNLAVESVTTWDDFVKTFLKKFYPIHKTILIRKNIMQFRYCLLYTSPSPRDS